MCFQSLAHPQGYMFNVSILCFSQIDPTNLTVPTTRNNLLQPLNDPPKSADPSPKSSPKRKKKKKKAEDGDMKANRDTAIEGNKKAIGDTASELPV